MAGQTIAEVDDLEPFEGGTLEVEAPAAPPGTDKKARPPVLIFLVPGIRSSRRWAVDLQLHGELFSAEPFEAFVVSPYDRLSSLHVVFRFRLDRMREEIRDQILARRPSSRIHWSA